MKSTHEFVEKLHETQAKDERNRRIHGNGDPASKLPTKHNKYTSKS